MQADLHLHTHHSDGTWSPAELVEHAVTLKLTHIAVTDHDTVAGIKPAIEAAAGRLTIISGVEINTVIPRDDGTNEDVHVLGYFIDTTDRPLNELLQRQRQARLDHIEAFRARLKEDGMDLPVEAIKRASGVGSIGKAHITQSIVDMGFAADINDAYKRFLTPGCPYYVRRRSVSPEEAIQAINRAGGIASIAHPGKKEHMPDLILRLKDSGLQAIEAFHRMHSVTLVRKYIRFANKNGLLITGGSDCHGPYREYPPSMGSINIPEDIVLKLIEAGSKVLV